MSRPGRHNFTRLAASTFAVYRWDPSALAPVDDGDVAFVAEVGGAGRRSGRPWQYNRPFGSFSQPNSATTVDQVRLRMANFPPDGQVRLVMDAGLWCGLGYQVLVLPATPAAAAAASSATTVCCSSIRSAPVMMATTSAIVWSDRSTSATRRPRRWMWIRSAISNTCGMLWLMSTTGRPRSRSP